METNSKSRTNSVSFKLILVMALIVVIPVVALTLLSLSNTIKQGTFSANEVNTAQSAIVQARLNVIFNKNIEALRSFASTPTVRKYLQGDHNNENLRSPIYTQMLDIDRYMDDGNSTALSDSTGQQLVRTIGKLVNVSERDYFQIPMSGTEYYISDLIISKSTGTAIATISVPVWNDNRSEVIGIVQRNLDCGVLHDLVAEEVTQDRQEIVVVDRTGTVVAHSVRTINVEEPEMQDQNPFYTDSRGDKTSGDYVAPFMGDTWMISWSKIDTCGWVVASCRVKEVALQNVYDTVVVQAGLGALFIIIAIILAIKFAGSITKPLKNVNNTMNALSEGRFFRIKDDGNRKDEFGEIISSTNNVIEKLESIVGGIVEGARSVNAASDELEDMSTQISQNAEDVSNAIQEIAGGASQQADEINGATESIDRIGIAVNSVQEATADLANIATRMQESSADSAHNLEELKKSSETMNGVINTISGKISATSDAVGRINGMVAAITSIATQTNLLALNASIEAARAGDAGRGFAVVAEEIGKLASDSSNSASQIRSEMDELLKQSQEAVAMADEVQKTNNKQQAVIDSTYNSVNIMIGDINETVNGVTAISANADACVNAKDIVVDAMASLSSISEENAASSEETGASMEELAATVSTLTHNADSLKQVSEELTKEMSFFKLD
ncbi:MAG: methyl-accepting chemotaxis protein [Lachnospiraceae bacterium]|nr:methyl-accepting chemotaxis protein [Lachnospiraceae bacterium]